MKPVKTGLEGLIQNGHQWVAGSRLGLLCNPASVDAEYRHARDCLLQRFPGQLKALYSPQHAGSTLNYGHCIQRFLPVVTAVQNAGGNSSSREKDPLGAGTGEEWTAMSEFIYMGGYGVYVWSAYGLSLLVLVANVIAARLRNQNAKREVRKYVGRSQ